MNARMHIVQRNPANCIYLAWKEGQRQSVSGPPYECKGFLFHDAPSQLRAPAWLSSSMVFAYG